MADKSSRDAQGEPVVTQWEIQVGPIGGGGGHRSDGRGHNPRNFSASSAGTTMVHPAASVSSSNGVVVGARPMSAHSDTGRLIPVPQPQTDKIALAAIILLGMMFSCLDMSIVSTALVEISKDLDNDYLDAPWVILAYLLTYMAFSVGISKLSDIYGRRNMLVASWVFFSGWSVLCAFAQTMAQLIVGRALQGIGGAGLYSLAQICLIELGLGGPETVGAMIGITLSISYVLGPLLGGIIASRWRWAGIFAINFPVGVLALGVIFFYWPDTRTHRPTWQQALAKIDFMGNVLLVGASVMLIFALQQGGSLAMPWTSPAIVSTLLWSALCWIALFAWEVLLGTRFRRLRLEAIFPLRLAKKQAYLCSLFATFFTGWSFVALVVDIPERLQIVNGESSLAAGLHLLPLLGATALGSFVAGVLNKKTNFTGFTTFAGCVLQALGLLLLYHETSTTNQLAAILGYTALYGFGVGLVFAAATMLTTVEARHIDLAAAQGAVAQARVLGGSIGLSVGTIIFNSLVESRLVDKLTPNELDHIHRSPIAVLQMPADLQPVVKDVYTSAFTRQMMGLFIVAIIGTLFAIGTFGADRTPVSDLLGQPMMMQPPKTPSPRTSDMELADLEAGGRAVAVGARSD